MLSEQPDPWPAEDLPLSCSNHACYLVRREKMVEGRVNKLVKEKALLEQAFIKDTSKNVSEIVKETSAAIGEKVSIRRFSR